MKKILGASLVVGGLVLIGAGCLSSPSVQVTTNAPTPPAAAPLAYTDAKTGIGFATIPEGWKVTTDEAGALMLMKENPYSTVGFNVFSDKTSWQKRAAEFEQLQEGDVLVDKKTVIVGGFPGTEFTYRRDSGGVKSASSFQYVERFIDGSGKWYEISTSDPSPDIDAIIQGVRF